MTDEAVSEESDYRLRLDDPTRLRKVTFFDTLTQRSGGLHVTAGILLNDQPVALRVPGRNTYSAWNQPDDGERVHSRGTAFEWSVSGGSGCEVILSMLVHPDDVMIGGESGCEFRLAGMPVFTPLGPYWERVIQPPGTLAYPVSAETGLIGQFPVDHVGVRDWVRVYMQVDEVSVEYRSV